MKILIINPILRSAEHGIIPAVDSIKDCMIYNLGMGFKNLGHEVTLFAAKGFEAVKKEAYDFEVIFKKCYLKKIFDVNLLPGLICYLIKNKGKFDLIISSEIFSIPSLFAVMISPQKTVIWNELNVFPNKYKQIPAKIWYGVFVKLFFQKSLVVPRSISAGEFVRRHVRYPSKLIVEHGINLDNFVYSKEKDNYFIVVSQLVPRKNIESIIQKFYAFNRKYNLKDFKLLIAGRGCSEESIRAEINNLDLQNNVELLGFKSHKELGKLISRAVAMLVNTKQDLNMVTIPEAIASGTPVITNTEPSTAAFITENNLGVVLDNWDEDTLYDFLQNKEAYIDSCISQRHKLSTEYCAQLLIDSFLQFKK